MKKKEPVYVVCDGTTIYIIPIEDYDIMNETVIHEFASFADAEKFCEKNNL